MSFFRTLAIGLGFAAVGIAIGAPLSAAASGLRGSEFSQAGNKQQGYGKDDINGFCLSDRVTAPEPGMQFDGVEASAAVLEMVPGRYEYSEGGILLFFPDGQFLLRLPDDDRDTIYGTDGSDLLGGGGILGGCFVEQLSEVLVNNSLSADAFVLVSPYDS